MGSEGSCFLPVMSKEEGKRFPPSSSIVIAKISVISNLGNRSKIAQQPQLLASHYAIVEGNWLWGLDHCRVLVEIAHQRDRVVDFIGGDRSSAR